MRPAAVGAALLLGGLILQPVPSWGDGGAVPGVLIAADGDGVVSQSIEIVDIFPSARQQTVLLLEGEARESARRVRIAVSDLADLENGCGRPEAAMRDDTCADDAGQGELSSYLTMEVQAGRELADGSRSCQATGPVQTALLADLTERAVEVGLPDDDGVLCVVATFEHLITADDNVTQSDSTAFDLQVSLDTVQLQPEVAGEEATETPSAPGVQGGGQIGDRVVTPTSVDAGALSLGSVPTGHVPALALILTGTGLLFVAIRALVGPRRRIMTGGGHRDA